MNRTLWKRDSLLILFGEKMNLQRGITFTRLISSASFIGLSSLCLAASPGDLEYVDVTVESGLSEFTHGVENQSDFQQSHFFGGIGLGDFDRDGDIDVYLTSGGITHDHLYLNDGNGVFTDVSDEWGLQASEFTSGVGVGDFDNDGWLDISVSNIGDSSLPGGAAGFHKLYRNINGTRFEDVALSAGVNNASPGPTKQHPSSASMGDFNADGHLDLIFTSWSRFSQGNRFYTNNGDGTFTDVTVSGGFLDSVNGVRAFASDVVDMDGDLVPEILWVADFNDSRYFVNNGDDTFSDASATNGTCGEGYGMGSNIADLDGNGRLDWLVSSVFFDSEDHEPLGDFNGNGYYSQVAPGFFVNLASSMGLSDTGWSWSSIIEDLDNDGLQEVFVGEGAKQSEFNGTPEYLLKQPSFGSPFFNVTESSGITTTGKVTAVSSFDMDGDGDLDLLYVCNGEGVILLRNDTRDLGSWLRVCLGGDPEQGIPLDGFNSRVEARMGTTVQTRYMNGHVSYGVAGPQNMHFGFGDEVLLDELTIRWINGEVTVLTDVPLNQELCIDPPSSVVRGDLDGDGLVSPTDLTILLARWGVCADVDACIADLDGDGLIGPTDLTILLAEWS